MATELTIINGRVLGADGADAVRIRGGRIAAVGRAADVGRGGEVVDARGGLVLPGFDDAHTHVQSGARSMTRAQLYPLQTVEAMLDAIRLHAAATPDAPWVLGRGWLYAPFPGGLPTAAVLDRAVPDRPAWMDCYDGHTGSANTAALRAAGIDRTRPTLPTARSSATRTASRPARSAGRANLVERPRPRTIRGRGPCVRASSPGRDARPGSHGRAGCVADARGARVLGPGRGRLRAAPPVSGCADHGERPDRWPSGGIASTTYERVAFGLRGGDRLEAGILKGFADGVIEARTASMLEPYEGDTSSGMPAWEPDELDAFIAEADRRGWQVEMHAIGDRGVRLALDAFEHAARANGPWAGDPRGTGRHPEPTRGDTVSSTSRPSTPPTSAGSVSLGVVASMQPYHGDPSPNQMASGPGASVRSGRAGHGPGRPSPGPAGASRSAPTGRWSRSTRSSRSTTR